MLRAGYEGFPDCLYLLTVTNSRKLVTNPEGASNPEHPFDLGDAVELERIRLERERVALERARFESEQAGRQTNPRPSLAKGKSGQRPAARRPKPKREQATRRPPKSPSQVPVVLGAVALAGLVTGVGTYFLKAGSKQLEEVDTAEAPQGPSERNVQPLTPPKAPAEREPSPGASAVLGQASEHEEAGRFGASYAVLQAWIREHPESQDVVEARKQLLHYCRALINSETTRAAELQREGKLEEAIRSLEKLAGRLPPPLARDLRKAIRGLQPDETDAFVAAKPEEPEDLAKRSPTGDQAPDKGAQPATPSPEEPTADVSATERWWDDHTTIGSFAEIPYTKSKYYLIKSNAKKEYTKRYGKMLDRYFKRYRTVFKDLLPGKRYEKSEIWIYATQQEFMLAEDASEGTGGYYSPPTKRVVTFHGRFGDTGTTRTVLAHEATHQFEDMALQGNLYNAPIWIIEGLAVLFESAEYDGRKVHIGRVPRDRLTSLKRGLEAGALIPLRQLIRTPQPQFTGYHYAHAWGLIYMVLFSSDRPKVRKRNQKWFSDLFAAALQGPVSDRDVVKAMGGAAAFSDFEESWKVWIRDLPYDFEPKKR